MHFLVLLVCALAVLDLGQVSAQSYTELESLNPSQRAALEKLKLSVSSIVPHDYMKEEIFLVKYLQVTSFSARKAEDMIRETIKWRKQNSVDQWENLDYLQAFEKDYPTYLDAKDREGRPIVEAFYGDWNVRAAAVSGKLKQLVHYSLRGIERANTKVRSLQAEGKNITQFILLLNMDGFSVINQGCPSCLPFYLGFVNQAEKNWPNTAFRTILVNTPDSFELILNLIRPIMSPQTRAALKVFGSNKSEWKPYLENLIDPAEISADWFGGKKERKN